MEYEFQRKRLLYSVYLYWLNVYNDYLVYRSYFINICGRIEQIMFEKEEIQRKIDFLQELNGVV